MASVSALTDQDFHTEVLQSDRPVLADFTARWCGPCRKIHPIVEEIAQEFAHLIKVVRLDVESCGRVATQYSIMSVPTLVIFKEGRIIDQLTGLVQKEELVRWISSVLSL